MDNERDTHFQGSADHVYTKICQLPGIHIETDRPEQEAAIPRLIAQYAYDLAEHVLENQPIISSNDFPDNADVIREIPDLTE